MIENDDPQKDSTNKEQLLYQRLKESPHVSGLPDSYERFSETNRDSSARRKLYESLSNNPNIRNIPDDFERFSSVFESDAGDRQTDADDQPQPDAESRSAEEDPPGEDSQIRQKLISSLKEREDDLMDQAEQVRSGQVDETQVRINPRTGSPFHPIDEDTHSSAQTIEDEARQLREQRTSLLQEEEDASKEGTTFTERGGDQFTKSFLRMQDIGNNIMNMDNARVLDNFRRIDEGEIDAEEVSPGTRLSLYADADEDAREEMKNTYRDNISQNISDVIENKNRAEDLYENPMTKAMVQADSFEEGLDLFMQNPVDAITGLAAESSLQMVPGMALGAAGAMTGNPAVAGAGFMLGSGSVEFGAGLGEGVMNRAAEDDNTRQYVNEALTERGVVESGQDAINQFNTLKEYQEDVVSSLSDMPEDVRSELFDTFRSRDLITTEDKDGQQIDRFSGTSDEMLAAINDTDAARNFISEHLPGDKYENIDPSDVGGNVDRARRLGESIKEVSSDEDSILHRKIMEVVQDPEAMQEISNRAAIRGGVIGTAEGLGAVIPGTAIARQIGRARAMSKAMGGSGALSPSEMAKVGGAVSLGVGVDAAAGGAGEAGAQVATGEDIRAGEILAEAAPELISGPFDVGSVAYGMSDRSLTSAEQEFIDGVNRIREEMDSDQRPVSSEQVDAGTQTTEEVAPEVDEADASEQAAYETAAGELEEVPDIEETVDQVEQSAQAEEDVESEQPSSDEGDSDRVIASVVELPNGEQYAGVSHSEAYRKAVEDGFEGNVDDVNLDLFMQSDGSIIDRSSIVNDSAKMDDVLQNQPGTGQRNEQNISELRDRGIVDEDDVAGRVTESEGSEISTTQTTDAAVDEVVEEDISPEQEPITEEESSEPLETRENIVAGEVNTEELPSPVSWVIDNSEYDPGSQTRAFRGNIPSGQESQIRDFLRTNNRARQGNIDILQEEYGFDQPLGESNQLRWNQITLPDNTTVTFQFGQNKGEGLNRAIIHREQVWNNRLKNVLEENRPIPRNVYEQHQEEIDAGAEMLGVDPNIIDDGPAEQQAEEEPVTPDEPAGTTDEGITPETTESSAPNVARVPVSEVQADPQRFQNRESAYSEETVQSIMEDYDAGRLNPENIPPVKVWEDPSDGNTYVVGGHSRLEAFKRLGLPDIQVQYLQDMTEEQAIEQGRIDNALGTAETIPEQAKIVRDWMQNEDMTKTEIRDRAKQLFKNNNRIVQAFAALNPSGKAIQSYQALEQNQSGDRQRAERYAKYVGEARLRHPQLTDSHETELYNYLLEHDNQNTSTQRDWLSFVDEIVDRNTMMGEFDADSPLNIQRVKPRTEAEQRFDEQVQEARQELRNARTAFQEKVTEIEERRAEGETISEERADQVLKQYQDDIRAAERNLLQVKQQSQSVERARRDQSSLFGLRPQSQETTGTQAEPSPTSTTEQSESSTAQALSDEELEGTQMREPRVDDQWTDDPQSLSDIIDQLVDTVGLTIRQGRIRLRNALGQYDPKTGVARTRMIKSIRTIAHEAGHDMMEQYGEDLRSIINIHPGEVEALAYEGTPEGQEFDEGFAEFFRLFLLNPKYAQNNAPGFFEDFAEWLDNHPELQEGLRGIQDAYKTWQNQPSDKAAASEITNTPTKVEKLMADIDDRGVLGKMTDFKNKAYTKVVDELHPIRMAVNRLLDIHEENTGERLDLKTAEDSYRLSRLTADAYTAGQMDIEFGVENYSTAKAEGPALRDALETAFDDKWTKKNINAFGSYMASRRLIHEWDRYENGEIPNPPSKLSKGDHEMNVQRLEAEHPTFEEASEQVYEWNQNLWRKKRDAGLITEDQYLNGIENHPDYVPLQRDMSDRQATTGGDAGTGKSGVLRAFQGSDRDIMNPIESMMQDAYETAVFVKQNDAKKALFDLARRVGNPAGEIVEEIPGTQAVGFEVDPKDVLKKVQKETDWNMLGERDALTYSNAAAAIDNMDLPMVSMYKQGEINEKGEPIIYVWENGERKALRLADSEFGVDMYQAYVNLGRENSDIITNALAYPASWLRYGVTTDPSFFVANLARDQVAAWILTEDFTPVISAAEGLSSEINQDEYSRLYRSMSGLSTENTSAINKSRVQQEIKDLRKKNIVVRRLTSVRGFAELTDISETSTRIGVFKRTLKKAKERGLSDKEAALEAAYQSRDLIDFGRHGSKMNAARRLVTFMNAAIQGLDKGVRVLNAEGNLKKAITPFIKDVNGRQLSNREQRQLNLSKKAWLKTATIGMMGAALTALWMDEEDYDEINKTYMRSTHWMLPKPSTDENEVRNWVAIPKPFELAFLSNTFEHAVEGVYYEDPDAFNRWLGSMYEIMAPPTRAPGIAVPTEVWANKRFFDDRPIVQQRLQGLEPWKQYNSYTSDFGKWMGRHLNVSPAIIDHVVAGFAGSWGRSLLNLSSSTGINDPEGGWDDTWVARRFIRSVDRGAFSENNFWAQMSRNEGEIMSYYQTFRDLEGTGTKDEAQDYYEKLDDWQKLYVAQNFLDVRDIIPEDEVHPMDRARKASSTLSKLRSELREDENFEPSTKRQLDDLMDRLATAEYRNALIAGHHPSYREREMMDMQEILGKVRGVSQNFYENWLEDRYNANDLSIDPTGELLQYSRDFDARLGRYTTSTLTELQN